jgi:pimeloyl-ACP methyl ester carboxylesterase
MTHEQPLLAYDVVAGPVASGDVVVFAHGILGSRNNWRSFANRVVAAAPAWTALLVDLRNHGQSRGQSPPHSVDAAADDVVALCRHLGLRPRAVVGHSWGGKAMLALALRPPARTGGVDLAVIVDSPPGTRTFGEQREEIDRVVAAIGRVPLPVPSRRVLVEQLRAAGLTEPVAQWMTTNLEPDPLSTDGGLRWKFQLAAIPSMLADFGALDLWPALRAHAATGDLPDVVFVRGGRSDRWSTEEVERLKAAVDDGVVVDHVLPAAGHWVHTDDPDGLLSIVVPLLHAHASGPRTDGVDPARRDRV